MAHLYLDLCLSDIPKDLIKEAANGKKYLKAIIRPRTEIDRDGYDHYVAAWVPKEKRNAGDRPAFFGRAQLKGEYDDNQYQQHKQALQPAPADDPSNDLPW